ncbi:SurA N-terminal domain-containing protein [Allosphingosinicella sp.]|jgi:peptidyl-prolyl cis-trans isomerase D|uniref:peptidylprolyl isomerase n=1 Tax=Allosphingosinicella sp. TaxID=2823234 RepID=UPI002EF82C55
MLRTFRRKLTSWLMLGFLGLAVLAIVVTGFGTGGIGGLPAGGTAGVVLAEVEGQEIKSDQLETLLRRQLDEARRQNPNATMAMLLAQGAYDRMLYSLISARSLWAFGRQQGLTVSDRMIDSVIANYQQFKDFSGQFDEGLFRRSLQAAGISEQQLRQEIALDLMQQQLQVPVALNARLPDSVVAQYAAAMLERRLGSIVIVPTEIMKAGVAPSDAQIAAHYQRNRQRFTVPERRVLRYALLGREQLGDSVRATDAEIAAFYQRNSARFAGTENRVLQQVVVQDEAIARRIVAQVQGGSSFAAAAQQAEFSASDIALGAKTRQQYAELSSNEVANAVFGAAQGATVGPLRSPLGWHVVRVEGITRTAGKTIEAARAEIAPEIERGKLQQALTALVTRIDERVGNEEDFEQIVRAERLTVTETPPVTSTGAAPGVQWQAGAELPQLLGAAFAIDPDDPQPMVETLAPNQRYAFVSVARTIPAAVPPLAQIREAVLADLIRETALQRAKALAERIAARINGGVPVQQAVAEAGVALPPLEVADDARINVARAGRQAPVHLATLFRLRQGRAAAVPRPAGSGWSVVIHVRRTPGQANCPAGQENAPSAPEGCLAIRTARSELNDAAGSEYADQFARAAQRGLDVTRSEDAVAETRRRLQSGSAQ